MLFTREWDVEQPHVDVSTSGGRYADQERTGKRASDRYLRRGLHGRRRLPRAPAADVTDEHGREPLLATSQGRVATTTIRRYVYTWSRPYAIRQGCPHDRDPDEFETTVDIDRASGCPSSVTPHPIRRGYIITGSAAVTRRGSSESGSIGQSRREVAPRACRSSAPGTRRRRRSDSTTPIGSRSRTPRVDRRRPARRGRL